MPINDLAELSNYAEYKKELKRDIAKLKVDKRVDIHVIFKLKYADDKERVAIILGPIAKKLGEELKKKSIIPKKGKCTRVVVSGEEKLKIQGGIPILKLAPLLKDAASPIQDLIENDDPVDLTTEDGLDDPVVAPTVASSASATPQTKPAPPKAADVQAAERAAALGSRAQQDLGLAKPTATASKAPVNTPVKGIQDVGPAEEADLADPKKPVYKQGAMAKVDVAAQKGVELQQNIDKLIAEYGAQLLKVNETITSYTTTMDELTALQKQLTAVPDTDAEAHRKAQLLLVEVKKELGDIKSDRSKLSLEFRDKVQKLLKSVKEEKSHQRRYEMLMEGREEDIQAVYKQIQDVYAATNRRLVVLGRTADTFAFKDQERVLHADKWSIGVNDSFMKSGLDQKAEFALLTKFKPSVKAKIKELMADKSGKSVEDVIKEFRAFVKREADPALWTGNLKYNDGYAVSMREVEQLLRDGYTMQEFDPSGEEFAGEGAGTKQVMIPKGMGAKIGAELASAAEARKTATPEDKQIEDRWKRVQPNAEKALKTAGRSKVQAQIDGYSGATEPDKAKKQVAALDALEKLVSEHLLLPRQELQVRLKGLLQSPGFATHGKKPAIVKLIADVQVAMTAADLARMGLLLDQIEAGLAA